MKNLNIKTRGVLLLIKKLCYFVFKKKIKFLSILGVVRKLRLAEMREFRPLSPCYAILSLFHTKSFLVLSRLLEPCPPLEWDIISERPQDSFKTFFCKSQNLQNFFFFFLLSIFFHLKAFYALLSYFSC